VTEERRRSARMKARQGSQGQLRSTLTIDILDLSVDGVRFELSSPLRPQAVYDFRTVIGALTVATQLRITRCAAGGYRDDGRGGASSSSRPAVNSSGPTRPIGKPSS